MTTSAAKANRNAEIVDRLEAEIERLREQLRDQRCPNDSRWSIRQCVGGKDGRQCGCTNGLILPAATGRTT